MVSTDVVAETRYFPGTHVEQKCEDMPEYCPTLQGIHVLKGKVENVDAAHGVHADASSEVAAFERYFP